MHREVRRTKDLSTPLYSKIQEFMHRNIKNVGQEMSDHTGSDFGHRNSNRNLKKNLKYQETTQ
jgi:hypothetical protein